jgi:hypothetical protein
MMASDEAHRVLEVLAKAAAHYEDLEAFGEAAEQHYIAATTADAVHDTAARDVSAAAFLRLKALSDGA